jgi:hypothetical protein
VRLSFSFLLILLLLLLLLLFLLLLLIFFLQSPSSVCVLSNMLVFCIKMDCTEQALIAEYCRLLLWKVPGSNLGHNTDFRGTLYSAEWRECIVSLALSLFFLFLLYSLPYLILFLILPFPIIIFISLRLTLNNICTLNNDAKQRNNQRLLIKQ